MFRLLVFVILVGMPLEIREGWGFCSWCVLAMYSFVWEKNCICPGGGGCLTPQENKLKPLRSMKSLDQRSICKRDHPDRHRYFILFIKQVLSFGRFGFFTEIDMNNKKVFLNKHFIFLQQNKTNDRTVFPCKVACFKAFP